MSAGAAPRRLVEAGIAVMLVCAPVSISGTQFGLGLAALGALVETARSGRLPRTPLDEPILALLAITALSAICSEAPGESLRRCAGSWIILAYYLVTGWLGEPARLERFLRLFLVPATLVGAYGIVQHYTGWNLFASGGGSPLHGLELGERTVYFPRGGFSHYQTFANVYFILFSLAFALAAGSSGRRRLLRGAASAFLALVVVFSFTRGIWLSLLAALGIFARVFARRAALASAATGAMLLAAALLASPSLRTRVLSMADVGSNAERPLLWETTWNMLRDRPLLGVGIGNYRRSQAAYVREEVPMVMTSTHAHNIWLQAAVERGFLGMLALLWLMAALLREALRAQRLPVSAGALPRALAVGGLAAVCGFLIDGLVQNNFGDSQAALLFWLAAGVVVVCGRTAAAAPAAEAAA